MKDQGKPLVKYEIPPDNDSEGNNWRVLEEQRFDKKGCPESSRKHLKMAISSTILLLANFLYLSADIKCPYTNDPKCTEDFISPNILSWTFRFGTSAILFFLIILLGISYSIVPRNISILAVVSAIYLTTFHNNSIEHGNYLFNFGSYKI